MSEEENGTRPSQRRRKKEPDNVFYTKDGRNIRLAVMDLLFVNTVMSTVPMPEVPTYTAKTMSGRIEVHPMDEKAAKQTPGGEEIWDAYIAARNDANALQSRRSMRAMLLDGTLQDPELYSEKWYRRMEVIGIPIPEDPDECWLLYLTTTLAAREIVQLTNKILALSGTSPELQNLIEVAGDSFRPDIQGGEESEDLENAVGSETGVAVEPVAT